MRSRIRDVTCSAIASGTSIVISAHAYQNRRIYRALCGRQGGTIVHRHLHGLVAGALRAHLAPHLATSGSPIPADAIAEFYTSALLGILTWWIDQGFAHGPDHVAQIFGALANPGLLAATRPAAPLTCP